MAEFRLEPERLILRDWRDADLPELHAICSDPLVMATIGHLRTVDESRELLRHLVERTERDGHTFWAIERKHDGRMLGFCGVSRGAFPPIEGVLEIGWRLASDCWGQSYVREAAEATLSWLTSNRPGEPVCAITTPGNSLSLGLMKRLGMYRDESLDFDHPNISDGSPLKPQVTYWLDAER
jgi:RimJ/RimL family protein N-acetyltransferase